jgi:hypothetical protein
MMLGERQAVPDEIAPDADLQLLPSASPAVPVGTAGGRSSEVAAGFQRAG